MTGLEMPHEIAMDNLVSEWSYDLLFDETLKDEL